LNEVMKQSRLRVKQLSLAARRGDVDAARALLAHSVVLGHDRLGIQRYFAARFLGAGDLDRFKPICAVAASHIPANALLTAARKAARNPGHRNVLHIIASELLPFGAPFVLPYAGIRPRLATDPRSCGQRVSLLGKIELGADPVFGPGAVVRADGHFVHIGDKFCIGEMSTVHIAHEVYPTIIGNRVTVGPNTVVHACTVGNDCVIADNVVILDGTKVEDGVLVEAGSIVFPRSVLNAGLVYSGSPAKPIRQLQSGERERRDLIIRESIAASLFAGTTNSVDVTHGFAGDVFIAATAHLSGRIEAGAGSSVYFGCKLEAGNAAIVIGDNSNVQDNTIIDASDGEVVVGENTTIGHNVRVRACKIGSRSLIGIGSDLAAGTIVDEDVLLAAGAITLPKQHLERSWLWGGRPARPILKLDDVRREGMSAIVQQYCAYAADYLFAQNSLSETGGSNGTSPIAKGYTDR
jgi:carbonic anhydrase/acetyltransferase-like protein (isoleucine patch superfamily)